MRSMTGFGRGVADHGDVRATVDVRAVNHRFLDLKLRGAAIPAAVEDAIGGRVRAAVERGSVTVSVNLARGGAAPGLHLDGDAAARAFRALSELATRLGTPGPDLALVLAQPGVVTSAASAAAPDDDAVQAAALGALTLALLQLAEMRDAEGQVLAAELGSRLGELLAVQAQIALAAAQVPQQAARKLLERIKRLALPDEVVLDGARLAQEVALHADRADITEELVRLTSHLDQARALIAGPGAVGRRLDFLVQEIGRELNTIGSKSQTAEISSAIVGAKATLEKIREQVQNVE